MLSTRVSGPHLLVAEPIEDLGDRGARPPVAGRRSVRSMPYVRGAPALLAF